MHTEGERKSRPAAAQGPYCAASCSLAWAKAWAGAAAAPHALAALLGEKRLREEIVAVHSVSSST
jgi:hypothetical protein